MNSGKLAFLVPKGMQRALNFARNPNGRAAEALLRCESFMFCILP